MQLSVPSYSAQSQHHRFGAYLNQQHFLGTLLLAVLLHLGGIALYHVLPHEMVEMIPVRVLNIKIGKTPPVADIPPGDISAGKTLMKQQKTVISPKEPPAPKDQPKKTAVVKPASKSVPIIKKAPDPVKTVPSKVVASKKNAMVPSPQSSRGTAKAKTAEDVARQYIREDSLAATSAASRNTIQRGLPAGYGSPIGNSLNASAEIERRYTQTLSLWINRFKIYPAEAQQAGIGGTVMLRIRINRQGRILQFYLEKTSGHAAIDEAISTMVNAANPVPAVPPYYPDSRPYLEFLVPIHFKP